MGLRAAQGQGRRTADKERALGATLKVSFDLVRAPHLRRFGFYYADLNAGCGWNEDAGCPGSPRIFLDVADASGHPDVHAFFVDRRVDAIRDLERNVLRGRPNAYPIHYENREVLPMLGEFIRARGERPEYAVGAIFIDPNGYFGDEVPPRDELRAFARAFPRIDLIINCNLRSRRLFLSKQGKGFPTWDARWVPEVEDLRAELGRPYMQVQVRPGHRGDDFVTVVLRSMPTGDHRRVGLYDADSPEAQMMLRKFAGGEGYDELGTQAALF
jgi:hypothetical protein